MEQFRVAADGRLEIQGTWDGVPAADLEQPVLVLHFEDRIADVDADRVRGTARKWYASFPWNGDPEAIRKAVLHVGGRLRVDLGPHPTTRRRLGRTALPALALLEMPGPVVPEIAEADILSTHTELAELRDRLAAVEEEAQQARDNATQAWAEAERARVLRERESERLHDAMDSLRRSAHDAVEADRERLRMQGIELEQLRAELARLAEVEAERDAALAARDAAQAAGDEAVESSPRHAGRSSSSAGRRSAHVRSSPSWRRTAHRRAPNWTGCGMSCSARSGARVPRRRSSRERPGPRGGPSPARGARPPGGRAGRRPAGRDRGDGRRRRPPRPRRGDLARDRRGLKPGARARDG